MSQISENQSSTASPDVVVVSLIWPSLTDWEREQCQKVLTPVSTLADQQNLLDELAAHLTTGTIKSPPAYLRRLTNLHLRGELVFEHAGSVQARRAALLAHQKRLDTIHSPRPTIPPIAATHPHEQVVKEHLQRLRELRKDFKRG